MEEFMELSTYQYYDKLVKSNQQSQRSTYEQLQLLVRAANKLGLYDAADCVSKYLVHFTVTGA